jgi:hypothetical protein
MKLGIVLARRADLALAHALTAAALRAGDEVRWFVMDEGVEAIATLATEEEPIELVACATSVDQRSLALPPHITLGSQDDHAALLAWADRTVALT